MNFELGGMVEYKGKIYKSIALFELENVVQWLELKDLETGNKFRIGTEDLKYLSKVN